MLTNTTEIMERGMNCLLEHLGTMDTEIFISIIIRERFNYTEWRKELFGEASIKEINSAAAEYARHNSFQLTKL